MYKVLVVDDDIDLLTVTALVLRKNNFEVEAISNWEEIKPSIKSFAPDLVVLDVSLNDNADGRVICREIKTADATKHIAVLLVSGNYSIKQMLPAFLPDGFIPKPFEVPKLVAEINSILAHSPKVNVENIR